MGRCRTWTMCWRPSRLLWNSSMPRLRQPWHTYFEVGGFLLRRQVGLLGLGRTSCYIGPPPDVQPLDDHRVNHSEVDVTLRELEAGGLGYEGDADHHKKRKGEHSNRW